MASNKPTRSKLHTLEQVCKLIPPHVISNLAKKHGAFKQARTFMPVSHIVCLLFAQLVRAISLNDVCDGLEFHRSRLFSIRGATPPKRNTLSHANKTRDPAMAEELFWWMLAYFQKEENDFGNSNSKGLPKWFKRTIHILDATTIKLVVNCIDWAKHRRKKAGAKLHLRMDLRSFLPGFVVIGPAKQHDSTQMSCLCDEVKNGEIVIFDKAYIKFKILNDLTRRGVFWVTRAKSNMSYRCVKKLQDKKKGNIIRDDQIKLTGINTAPKYPQTLRRIEAYVEINGKLVLMQFITNNFDWAASSVASLYKARWSIEVFFKEIKQTLQLTDFLGHNENAILWQIWTALLLHLLVRFLQFKSRWSHGFKRLISLIRSIVWDYYNLDIILLTYGTAANPPPMRATPENAYFPEFDDLFD